MSRRPPIRLWTGLALLLAGLAVAAPAPASAESGLALRYPLDTVTPGDPPTTPDLSGNGFTGKPETTFAQVPGRFGGAMDFSGLRRITAPSPLSPNFGLLEPQQLTVALWMRRSGFPGATQYLVSKGEQDCATAASYAIYTGYGPSNLGLQFYVWNSTKGASVSPNAGGQFYDGNWHAVAGTFDGTTSRLYVDGKEIAGAAPGAGGPITYALPGSRDFVVGGYPDNFSCGNRFAGSLDEVRVYDRALSAAEIARLQDPAATAPPDLGASPGGGGGSGGGGGAGGGSANALKVSLTAPSGALKAGAPVSLAANASGGAAIDRYLWDLNGNGTPDAECNGAAPILQEQFTRAYTGPVSVTAIDTTGASATSTAALTIGAGTRPAGVSALVSRLGGSAKNRFIGSGLTASIPVGICTTPPGQKPGDVTPSGGPPAGCANEVVAGLVSAIGCLTQIKKDDLPPAERATLYPYLSTITSSALNVKLALGAGAGGARASAIPGPLDINRASLLSLFGTTFLSQQTVRINGVDYQPAKGASIVVIAGGAFANPESYVVSSDAIVSVNGVTLRRGPLRLRVDLDRKQVHVTDFVLSGDVPFTAGLAMARGRTSLDIDARGSLLATHLRLPGIFGGVTGEATIRLSNPAGARLSALKIDVGQFKLAGVGVDHADLTYSDNPLRLAGSAKVQVAPDGAGPTVEASLVLAAPPGKRTLQFQSFAGSYTGPPFIPLAPGVDLFGINGSFALYPPATELGAGATVTVGAPVQCPPYRVDGQALVHFYPSPVTFDFTGKGSLFCLPIAEEYLHVEDTGYVAFGGRFNFDAKVFSLSGRLDAQFLYPHFQAEGQEKGCIAGYFCAGGRGIVSDRGAAFCLQVDVLVDTIEVGAGFDWPPPASLANPVATALAIASRASVFTGCGFGKWRTVSGAHASQAGERSFGVPAGLPAFSLAVAGSGGVAPDVELRGPKGESFVLPASGRVVARGVTGFRSPVDGTAYFAVAKPSAGTWRVVPRAGSSAVTSLRRAAGLPDPSVVLTRAAAPAGSGAVAFRYRIRRIAGQRVTFVERAPGGSRVVGVARGASGVLRFAPSDARGTKRSIVALVEQDGQPRANLTVARFTAAQARPGRVAGVRVARVASKRGGGSVRVSWGRAAGATRYEATVRLSDGRSLLFVARKGARSARVPDVTAGTRVRVRVVGVRGASRRGPAAVGVLRE